MPETAYLHTYTQVERRFSKVLAELTIKSHRTCDITDNESS